MALISRNRLLVLATDRLPSSIRRIAGGVVHRPAVQPPVEGIAMFCQAGSPRKRALLTLSPDAWHIALRGYPNISIFNYVGLTFEVVRALNLRGFLVDIVDYRDPRVLKGVQYDLILAHGPCCGELLGSTPNSTFVIQYASGAYWKAFNAMSRDRYHDFCIRRKLPEINSFIRSLDGGEDGEEILARRADATFIPGPRTLETWRGVSKRPRLVFLSAYREKDLVVKRDFESGRRNFLYVAGTGGNIQKGLDVLLEAFSRNKELHLYIYCRIEDEVLHAYRDILAFRNIHYIYHLRWGFMRLQLARLLTRINFTITAPITTGPGTAYVGSLGLGLIPVGFVDLPIGADEGCLSESWRIDAIEAAIRAASEMPLEWFEIASELAVRRYILHHDPAGFAERFGGFCDEVMADR